MDAGPSPRPSSPGPRAWGTSYHPCHPGRQATGHSQPLRWSPDMCARWLSRGRLSPSHAGVGSDPERAGAGGNEKASPFTSLGLAAQRDSVPGPPVPPVASPGVMAPLMLQCPPEKAGPPWGRNMGKRGEMQRPPRAAGLRKLCWASPPAAGVRTPLKLQATPPYPLLTHPPSGPGSRGRGRFLMG